MIYHFSALLGAYWPFLYIFHYISVRMILALLTALFLFLLYGRWFIDISMNWAISGRRAYLAHHGSQKCQIPSMGGIFIIGVLLGCAFLWTDVLNCYVGIFLLNILLFGVIGWLDDRSKIVYHTGISAGSKFMLQIAFSLIIALFLYYFCDIEPLIAFPFFKHAVWNIGVWYIPWTMFILIACSNAVNLTDGLDGLAIGVLIPNFVTFSLFCYVAGHMYIADYLCIPFCYSSEIAVLGAGLVGASLGFLWYNAYPAQIFMGDVGSLSMGAALGYMALLCKQELILPLASGLFVVETLSVIVQVISYKLYKKRLFKMAPLHHHLELIGWHEPKITIRFIIISIVFCLCAILTIKMR